MNCCYKKIQRKAIKYFFFLALCLLFGILSVSALERPEIDHAEYAMVYSVNHDAILFEKKADIETAPASTVKIMTGILAVEKLGYDLDRTITVTKEPLRNITGNNIALAEGEIVTVRDLLHALIVGGANDAAAVLAYEISGNLEDFVALMNAKASELGAFNTVYKNASGMDAAGMKTTISDTVKIATYAYQNSLYMQISSTSKYEMPATNLYSKRNIYNRNCFLAKNREIKYYYPSALGMNAGSTQNGGNCLVTAIRSEGESYIIAVMGAQSDDEYIYSYVHARALIDWALEAYKTFKVLDSSKKICEIPVTLSVGVDYVVALPAYDYKMFLPAQTNIKEEITYEYTLYESTLKAPIEEAQEVGVIMLSYQGKQIASIPLIVQNRVEKNTFLGIMDQISEFTASRWFIVSVITFIILCILYVILSAIRRKRKENHIYSRKFR